MFNRSTRILPVALALLPAIILVGADAAFASTSTGISQLDTSRNTIVGFVQGLAVLACIFLLGVLVWDFVQHRNIGRSIFEFLGVIILGIIAVNANTVAATFQGSGALIH
jgi:hypothetical protein